MMESSFQITHRYLIAFLLLVINSVHFMAIGFFEIPGNFAEKMIGEHRMPLHALSFGIAILTAIFYPRIVRSLRLKETLLSSLTSDLLSLFFLWLFVVSGGNLALIILSTIFKGMAFLTVTIGAITYLVIEFPNKLGASLMALLAFGDVGGIIANLLFNTLHGTEYGKSFFLIALFSLLSLIGLIWVHFFDPPLPEKIGRLRKESLIWRELHYRLALFLIAAIFYGIIESLFAIWGEVYLLEFMPQNRVTDTISFYWFAMMIGKFLLFLPLYFFSEKTVFPFLIISTMLSIQFIEGQTEKGGLLTGFTLAGLSLAAVMPMIIASMESEIIRSSRYSHRRSYIPYVEIGTALIIGAHYFGVGLMTLFVQMAHNIASALFFHSSLLITALIGLLIGYLNWTSNKRVSTK